MLTRERILQLLLKNKDNIISGQEIADKLGLSRSAIWKHINSLRNDGYKIKSISNKGYRLVDLTSKIRPIEIKRYLKTKKLGQKIYYFKSIDSTNRYLKKNIIMKNMDGAVAVTEVQTKGQGRRERTWFSPPGGLWFSILLFTGIPLDKFPLISLVVGLCIIEALENLYSLKAEIKWPNDVVAGDKKMGGILTEVIAEPGQINKVIIGIGINANFKLEDLPGEIASSSMTIKAYIGKNVNRAELMSVILNNLEKRLVLLKGNNIQKLVPQIKSKVSTIGRKVKIIAESGEKRGLAKDITEKGALVVELADGSMEEIRSADIFHLK